MKAECLDCGMVKTGCKTITKIINKHWIEQGAGGPDDDWIGKPVCRACLNFSKRLEEEFGPGNGFYEAS